MRSSMRLLFGILNLRAFWRNFIFLLIVLNGVLPWFFLGQPLAGWVLVGFYLGTVLMVLLTELYGFVRLLGMAHVAWLPFLFLMWGRAGNISLNSVHGVWFWLTLLIDSVAIGLDVWDISRYFQGESEEMVENLDYHMPDWVG